jgi:hypothetical protein
MKTTWERYRVTGRDADGELMKSVVKDRKQAERTARYWREQFNFTKVKIRGFNLKEVIS